MEELLKNYETLCINYKELENNLEEKPVHDKRVILRRIFSILKIYRQPPASNLLKMFNLLGKLRDIQIQILAVEELDNDLNEYLEYLKKMEIKLKKNIDEFSLIHTLIFDKIIVKKIDADNIYKNLKKKLKNIKRTNFLNKTKEFHEFRIAFKKFRYSLELLYISKNININELSSLKLYQDNLGEVQDLEVLIRGITKFFKKKNKIIRILKERKKKKIRGFVKEKKEFFNTCTRLSRPK